MKTCPNCKLINPVNAQYCDCGYNFHSDTVEESHAAPQIRKKSRFVFGVDATSIFLATPLAKILDFGGAIPITVAQRTRYALEQGVLVMLIATACFYASSFITNRISGSSLSQGKKVAVYISLVISYITISFLLFGLAEVIHESKMPGPH